jgi:NADP-dependent 3-hydroxy acid dehydrogenase YdfG
MTGPCIVVGAGAAIGCAIARRFAQEGLPVGLIARDAAKLEELAGTFESHPTWRAADAADDAALSAAIGDLETELGPTSVLVYNAAASHPNPTTALEPGTCAPRSPSTSSAPSPPRGRCSTACSSAGPARCC